MMTTMNGEDDCVPSLKELNKILEEQYLGT